MEVFGLTSQKEILSWGFHEYFCCPQKFPNFSHKQQKSKTEKNTKEAIKISLSLSLSLSRCRQKQPWRRQRVNAASSSSPSSRSRSSLSPQGPARPSSSPPTHSLSESPSLSNSIPIPFLFFLFRIRHPFHEIRPLNDAVLIEEEELDESRFQRRPLRLPLLPMTSSLTTSYDLSSLRDRTKDILSVVVALLFGVGSGALVAATMFLASSLFWNDYRSSSPYGDDSDEEEDLSPKKIGYVKILAAESESVPAPATT